MAKQTINQGTAPTGAGGDTFRSGSAKLQANDDEIYNWIGNGSSVTTLPAALPIAKGGTGATTAAAARTNLGLGDAATRSVGTSSGNVMQVGAFGLGNPAITDVANVFVNKAGFGKSGALGAVWYVLTGTGKPVIFFVSVAGPVFANIYSTDGEIERRIDLRTSVNTTVDSNGFLKNASPIVQLFADKIELNDEAQQQEITFEKLGIGNYLIKGSSGFAQEGWYIETPKDANGNVLFSVIYTTLENGDISVKTYKKKFDFETVSIVADLDNPVDITETRWIDLRLQELPQPEIEVTDDPEQ